MSLCHSHTELSREIQLFISNVSDVNEESITDYLTWKWREIDKRFKHINIKQFTSMEEGKTTGADFELELWIVGRDLILPLIFQAKKIIKPFNCYLSKTLQYPNGTKKQIEKLLSYSLQEKRIPVYAFYSLPDENTQTICGGGNTSYSGVFIADAYDVKQFADKKKGEKISKNMLLVPSVPFHCFFCCSPKQGCFNTFIGKLAAKAKEIENPITSLPLHAELLLNDRLDEIPERVFINQTLKYKLSVFRHLAVYDIRGTH